MATGQTPTPSQFPATFREGGGGGVGVKGPGPAAPPGCLHNWQTQFFLGTLAFKLTKKYTHVDTKKNIFIRVLFF